MNGKQILIVDDNNLILEVLEQQIEHFYPEFRVVPAQNGFVALDRLKKESFDLVVTDYNMPGMTGIDLAATIRQLSPQTLVVLMSADLNKAQAQSKAQNLELDGYLEKPIVWKDFWMLVSR
jgi:two-component system chemotaxis response regulator CheY